MVRTMRDLDQGYDYEVLNKKTQMLRKHPFFNPKVAVRGRRWRCCCCPIVTSLVVAWILFLILWMYSRSKGVAVFTVSQEKTYPANLVRIPAELANKKGAYCLDGTVPTYYFRKGKNKDKRSWLVHLAGGSWCWDLPDCYQRSFTSLGSSDEQYLPSQMELQGILSDNPDVNPDFQDWNVAHINYCDGAAFSGHIPYPVAYNDKPLYFRGALILDLVIKYLLRSGGLADAERIILSGNSAGGTAVVLHIDHIKSLIPEGIPFHGLVDAGIFLDAKNMTNFDHYRICTQRVYNIQQVWGSLDKDCLEDQSQDTKWKCYFTEYAYKYVQTPVFYMNSMYDYWQLWFILEMHCHPTQCPDKLSRMTDFNTQYFDLVMKMKDLSSKNGMFTSSCYTHCQAYFDEPFTAHNVARKTPQTAFGDWYFNRVPEGTSYYFDCQNPYDCNPTCDWSLDFYKARTERLKNTTKCHL